MKILVTRFSGGAIGGAELSARDITLSLRQLGHEVTFVNDDSSFVISPRPRQSLLWRVLWPLKACIFFFHTLSLCVIKRFDVLNPQSREDQIVLTAVGRLLNIPVVWRDPGDLVPQLSFEPGNWWQRLNRRLQLWAIARTDAVFTLNHAEAKQITQLLSAAGVERTIDVIKSNILFADYDRDARPLPTPADQMVIGFVSRLEHQKGLDILIDALTQLDTAERARLALWVLGDGSQRELQQQRADELDGLAVKFWGYQSELSPFYRSLDILVQSSRFEGWGRTVKEAMYFGLPVIGSDVGGIAEQIHHRQNGLLFPVEDVSKLSKQLRELLNDEQLRNQLGSAGRATTERAGDWQTTVEQELLPLFKRVVEGGGDVR